MLLWWSVGNCLQCDAAWCTMRSDNGQIINIQMTKRLIRWSLLGKSLRCPVLWQNVLFVPVSEVELVPLGSTRCVAQQPHVGFVMNATAGSLHGSEETGGGRQGDITSANTRTFSMYSSVTLPLQGCNLALWYKDEGVEWPDGNRKVASSNPGSPRVSVEVSLSKTLNP